MAGHVGPEWSVTIDRNGRSRWLGIRRIPGTALLTLTWYWLLRHGDLGRLSLFFYAVPAVGFGFSWVLYAEPITRQELGGIMLILLSIAAIFSEEWQAGQD
ncbi:EamA family transporter [Halomonas alkalicola]|uniref:EamA family transporter n=1 Tax=Halomonas alkalicola TaxID=1930622 RepID=A0ABY9H777_9GAMM|nr:EamA family transporter [Halomonas alkalicola]WLI74330.1 EamA family transporter [Halomonas alkalicola]